MARLNDDAQWIVLMGFMVSVGIFFLAIIINQSTLVGQTTSEAVLEFPKSEIQDVRAEILDLTRRWNATSDGINPVTEAPAMLKDLKMLAIHRNNALIDVDIDENAFSDSFYNYHVVQIHFNNGVTEYDETYSLPI